MTRATMNLSITPFFSTALTAYGTFLIHSTILAYLIFGKPQVIPFFVALMCHLLGRALGTFAKRLIVLRSFNSQWSENNITKRICGDLGSSFHVITLANPTYVDPERRYTPSAMFGILSGLPVIFLFPAEHVFPLSIGEATVIAFMALFSTDRWYWWRFRPASRRRIAIGFDQRDIIHQPFSELNRIAQRRFNRLKDELEKNNLLWYFLFPKFIVLLPISRIEIVCHHNYWDKVACACIDFADHIIFDITGLCESEGLQIELQYALDQQAKGRLRGRLSLLCLPSDTLAISCASEKYGIAPASITLTDGS